MLGLALGGSIARWLCQYVGPKGRVTATDLETGFLSELSLPNLDVLRRDVRTDQFPESSFELGHVRAVLMLTPDQMATLKRMVSRLAPLGLAAGGGARLWHVDGRFRGCDGVRYRLAGRGGRRVRRGCPPAGPPVARVSSVTYAALPPATVPVA